MKYCLPLLFLLAGTTALAQETITLLNPSFEDEPRCGKQPVGWENCGPSTESPADVLPGCFEVDLKAADGKTYLGLVVRDNETWEAVGQRLSAPLEHGKTYAAEVMIARSRTFKSLSRASPGPYRLPYDLVDYDQPAKLIFWGGHGPCDKQEVLFETPAIDHNEWKNYTLQFTPRAGSYAYLMIEAYYLTPVEKPYNGNILIDKFSDIIRIDR